MMSGVSSTAERVTSASVGSAAAILVDATMATFHAVSLRQTSPTGTVSSAFIHLRTIFNVCSLLQDCCC